MRPFTWFSDIETAILSLDCKLQKFCGAWEKPYMLIAGFYLNDFTSQWQPALYCTLLIEIDNFSCLVLKILSIKYFCLSDLLQIRTIVPSFIWKHLSWSSAIIGLYLQIHLYLTSKFLKTINDKMIPSSCSGKWKKNMTRTIMLGLLLVLSYWFSVFVGFNALTSIFFSEK